ncbi:glycosyltransferase family 4 protein [bacterium]|nr:glycosyltransferase family 4 protein [bacterium]
MNIAHIIVGTAWSGGQNQTYEILKNQPSDSKSILITVPGSILGEKSQAMGIKVYYLIPHSHIDFKYIKAVKEILIGEKIDIVNVHRSTVHTNMLFMKMFIYKKFKLVISRRIAFKQNIFSRFKYNNKAIDKLIAVSEEVKNVLMASGIPAERIKVIYSGVDTQKFDPYIESNIREELGISNEKEIITCIANFLPHKGLEYLLKAIHKGRMNFNDSVFLFAGKGTDNEEFLSIIKELNIGKYVIPLGYREDIPEILKATDVFVLPTLREGFSGVIREAMVMGKPVISTRIPENLELIRDSVNGFLCEKANSQDLIYAISRLQGNKVIQKEMGEKGRELVLNNFTIQRTINDTYDLYRSLLEK